MRDRLPEIVPEASKALGAIQELVGSLVASAYLDSVTGLLNGTALEKFEATFNRTHTFGAVFLDLTGFKAINDEHGHPAGDAALLVTGERLAGIATQHQAFAFRQHGDEFVLLARDRAGTAACAQAIAALFSGGLFARFSDRQIPVRGAVGYSVRQDNEATLKRLVSEADTAARLAKLSDDGVAVEWSATASTGGLFDRRMKCSSCRATATLLVAVQQQKPGALTHCPNCGAGYSDAP
jgi:diguanylate cyclase (GGDEF)-like protein